MSKILKLFDLSTPAPIRLAAMRRLNPADWRKARQTTHISIREYVGALSQGKNGRTPIWYAHGNPGFRGERFADEIARSINHRGWFTDDIQSGVIRGIVAYLPHGRYIAGYYASDSGERVYYPDVYDCPIAAANSADGIAEIMAENEREYRARYAEACNIREEIEYAKSALQESFLLRHTLPRCKARIPRLLQKIRELQKRLATEFADVEI